MSFPEIKRAERDVVECTKESIPCRHFGNAAVEEERLSRAKLAKELAVSLAVASDIIENPNAIDIILDVKRELLRVAKEDEK